MLQWIEASVWWSNRSTVATYKHASSTLLSTCPQLTGGDAKSEEPGRYSSGNSRRMVPEDPGAEPHHSGTLALDISVPMTPQGAPPAPDTSIGNAIDTADCQWMTRASNV
jgi:hypothetical protein